MGSSRCQLRRRHRRPPGKISFKVDSWAKHIDINFCREILGALRFYIVDMLASQLTLKVFVIVAKHTGLKLEDVVFLLQKHPAPPQLGSTGQNTSE